MAKRFDDLKIGDQIELPAKKLSVFDENETRNPDRPIRVGIVTDIWHDPVEEKEYIGIAYVKRGGVYGKPTEKRTRTGLAMAGWRKAQIDYIETARIKDEANNVVSLWAK